MNEHKSKHFTKWIGLAVCILLVITVGLLATRYFRQSTRFERTPIPIQTGNTEDVLDSGCGAARISFYGEIIGDLINDLLDYVQSDNVGFATRAWERVAYGDMGVYVPDNEAEIQGYYLKIVPGHNDDGEIDPNKEVDLTLICAYEYNGRVYDIVWTSANDLDNSTVSWVKDYEYETVCAGKDVKFYGYTYNDKSYISVFSAQIDGEVLWYVPNCSPHIGKQAPAPSIDILASDEFFDSLTEEFFKIDRISFAEYIS